MDTVGCNRRLKSARYQSVPGVEEWTEIFGECNICKFCSSRYCLPRDWFDLTVDEGNDGSTSSSDTNSVTSEVSTEEATAQSDPKRLKLLEWT